MLLSRAIFLSNLFHGSKLLSSFELVKGYASSVLLVISKVVTPEQLEANKTQSTVRELHRLMKARNRRTTPPSCLQPGTDTLFCFKPSKQNDPVEWGSGTVISAHPHIVSILTDKGRKPNISYEDIPTKPNSELAEELPQGYMEDYITYDEGIDS